MEYEWDENKNQLNQQKHGLCFEDAEFIFAGETITFEDDRIDYGEQRFITLGMLAGRVVVLIYTRRSSATRIISMRKANEREKEIYKKRLEETRRH